MKTSCTISCFVLFDGKSYVTLPSAKDNKRIGQGDTGLNTGGMGSVSPVPFANKEFISKVEERIIKPTINGIIKDKLDYVGFIFIGIIKFFLQSNITSIILEVLLVDVGAIFIIFQIIKRYDFNVKLRHHFW